MHKDIGLALAAARERGVALPSAGVADDMLTRAAELGYQHRDIAALYEVLTRGQNLPSGFRVRRPDRAR